MSNGRKIFLAAGLSLFISKLGRRTFVNLIFLLDGAVFDADGL